MPKKIIISLCKHTLFHINLIPIVKLKIILSVTMATIVKKIFFWKKNKNSASIIDYSTYSQNNDTIDELAHIPAEKMHYTTPVDIEGKTHHKFKSDTFCNPAIYTISLKRATVINTEPYILTQDNFLIDEINKQFTKLKKFHPFHTIAYIPPSKKISGTTALLAQKGQDSYFHWLFEILPKIHLIKQTHQKIDHYVVNTQKKFQIETLQLAGIDLKKTIPLSNNTSLICNQIITTTNTKTISNWRCQHLRSLFKKHMAPKTKQGLKLYVSRKAEARRNITNENEVADLLKSYGFISVDPGQMNTAEQSNIFSKAECIIGPHGGALANIVFASPGSKLIELFSPGYVNCCFWEIASQLNLKYYYLIGKGRSYNKRDPHLLYNDMTIDIASLQRTLEMAGQSPSSSIRSQ